MTEYFVVDHGLDSYEEWLDLDRIIFLRCTYKFNEELKYCSDYEEKKEMFRDTDISANCDYIANITFDNGIKEKIRFSAIGWHDFSQAMKKRGLNKERQCD